jgi:AmiR/NasT family two-component response regulator
MDQGNYDTHLSAELGDPRGREAGRALIFQAMEQIRAEHDVSEMSAYAILVQTAVDSHSSLRETATSMVTGSAQGPVAAAGTARHVR